MYIPDIASLLTVPFPVSPDEFIVAGYYAPGDGGGGTFVWIIPPIGGSIPPDDDGIIFYDAESTL